MQRGTAVAEPARLRPRPPIVISPAFEVTPVGYIFAALYVGWFSWSIFRPLSDVEEAAYERQVGAADSQLAAAPAFLKAAKAAEGAMVSDSGLVYRELSPGSGKAPTVDDTVSVHYTGKLADGTVFDSSYQRNKPSEFKLKQVIKGWTEGLQLMKPGGKGVLTIPPELGYGPLGAPPSIPGNSALEFTVELLEVKVAAGFNLPF